ncbi:unnamed protein product, partial [Ectocarpus fasciculatus]
MEARYAKTKHTKSAIRGLKTAPRPGGSRDNVGSRGKWQKNKKKKKILSDPLIGRALSPQRKNKQNIPNYIQTALGKVIKLKSAFSHSRKQTVTTSPPPPLPPTPNPQPRIPSKGEAARHP